MSRLAVQVEFSGSILRESSFADILVTEVGCGNPDAAEPEPQFGSGSLRHYPIEF